MQQRRISTMFSLVAWETLPSWELQPTPTCSSLSMDWVVGVGGNTSVLRGQRKGSRCQGSKSSYCLFSLLKQCERRRGLKLVHFQGSHMVPTDEAVWGFFCSLLVWAVLDVYSYLLLETLHVWSSHTLSHPACSKCTYRFFPKDWFLACCSTVPHIINIEVNGW